MSLKPFNFGIVTKRVLPLKAFKFSSAQPMDLHRILELVAWGARENLLEEISFSDDDIVSWSPENADDYKDKNSRLYAKLTDLKAKLDSAAIAVHSITCDLSQASIFAHGAFTNNDSKVRELARKKTERALEIGRFFNANLFVYRTDCEGFDSPFTVNWQEAWNRLANGLESISQYANAQKMTNYHGGVIAPCQSDNYHYGFLNTPSDTLAAINGIIKDRSFWGIAPSAAQLTMQGWEKAPAQIANIVGARRLAFLKVGGGTERTIHRAPHPILGTGNISETAQLFWLLARMNWKGVVEYDNLASVSDAKSNRDDMTCKQFLTNIASALTAALMMAERIKVNELAELTPSEADLMAATLIGGLDVDNIILRTIKKLPPAFETPQQQHPAQQNGGKPQQQQNAKPQNGKPQQPQNGKQRQQQNGKPQPKPQESPAAKDVVAQLAATTPAQPVVPNAQPASPKPIVAQPVVISAQSVVSMQPVAVQPVAAQPVAAPAEPVAASPVAAPAEPVAASPVAAPAEPIAVQPVVTPAPQPAYEAMTDSVPSQQTPIAQPPAADSENLQQPVAQAPTTKPAEMHHSHVIAPLPPPAPLLEEEESSSESTAEDALPLILPDEKKPKPRGRKVVARGRKASSPAKKRTPRKKPGENK